jgi:hypothetical protein
VGTTTFNLTTAGGSAIGFVDPSHVKVYTTLDNGATLIERFRPAQWEFNTARTQITLVVPTVLNESVIIRRITPITALLTDIPDGINLPAERLRNLQLANLYIVQEAVEANAAAATLASDTAAQSSQVLATVASQLPYTLYAARANVPANPGSAIGGEVLDSTNMQTFTPLTGVPSGFVGSSSLIVRIRYSVGLATWQWVDYRPINADLRYLLKTQVVDSVLSSSATDPASAKAAKTAYDAAIVAQASVASLSTTVAGIQSGIATQYLAVANVAAIPASPSNGSRIEIANSTGIESFAPLTGRPSGFVGSSRLSVRLLYLSVGTTWQWIDYSAIDPDSRYLVPSNSRSVFDFSGVVGDGVNNDTAGLQLAFDWAQQGTVTQGPFRKLFAPSGFNFRTTAPLTLDKPCHIQFLSFINYNATSGSAVVVGNTAPSAGRNKGYDLHFAGLRHTVGGANDGWASAPTAEFPDGANGIEFRAAQMSRFRVDEIQAFKGAGVFVNCAGAAVLGYDAHFQQNDILLGEIGYCSYGVRTRSKDPSLAAAQALNINIQSLNSNFKNLKIDEAGGVYNNTTSNYIFVNAVEPAASGGKSVEIFGSYNRIYLGFLEGTVFIQDAAGTGGGGGGAFFNQVEIGNNVLSGAAVTINANSGNGNFVKCAPPGSTLLPVSQSITAGTVYQNTTGRTVAVGYTANLASGASSSLRVGASSTVTEIGRQANDGPSASDQCLFALVPPWHYWQVVNSGTVTLSTARIYDTGI